MELARGTVTDRPWALTLATIVRRGVTGEITLVSDQKSYAIAFDRGVIIAARSPVITDSVVRVALTSHLLLPTQIGELNRRMTANPKADEVDLLGELAGLSPAQLDKLRTELTIRRAARTFALEHGEFVIHDSITLFARATSAVDIRAVIYYGVRMHVSDTRLSGDVRALGGSYFVLRENLPDLAKFGFGDDELRLLDTLRDGATIPELEARHRDIDPRAMLAAIYSLVAVDAVQVTAPPQTRAVRAPNPPIVAPTPPIGRNRRSSNAPPYVALARGTQDSIPPPPKASPAELAAEAVERANRALAADKPEAAVLDLKKAIELAPNNVDYNALLGWALFCVATDKAAAAVESRKLLERAVYKSQRPEVAQFYLGRVERMLGRDKEALRHFQAVLDVQPNHRDASAEVRILEARLRRSGVSAN